MVLDDITEILKKKNYDIDSDTISRIRTMLESIRDDNQINKLENVNYCFNNKREETEMLREEIGNN